MRRVLRSIAIGLAAAVALGACAAPRAVVMPAPPQEVRREAGAPSAPPRADEAQDAAKKPAGEPAAAPIPALPDPVLLYAQACDRTQGALARGAPAEAVPSWQAIEDTKWGTDAIFNQGVLFQLAGKLDEAAAQYGRAADRSPAFEPALANLLGISLLRGDKDRMRFLLARISPAGSAPAVNTLPELAVNTAAALMETGRADEAGLLLRSMRSQGRTARALTWNLAVLSYRNGDPAAARDLAKAVPPGVENLFPVVASRFAWAQEGEKVPALGPAPAGMAGLAALSDNLKAYAEYRGGSVEAAERSLASTAAAKSAPAEILTNIGMLQAERGRWSEARKNLERAVRENPALPAAWLNLGIFREVYEGNLAAARECYDNYVKAKGLRREEVRIWSDRLGQSASPR